MLEAVAKFLIAALLSLVFHPIIGHSQQSERSEDLDRRIDSLLRADPEWFGLKVDSLPQERIPSPTSLPSMESRGTGVRDLIGADSRRTLPSYTRAEGFVLAMGNADPAPVIVSTDFRLGLAADAGFAFGTKKWEWMIRIENEFLDRRTPIRLTLEGHDRIDSRESWKCGEIENSLAAMIAGIDARDFYAERRGASAAILLFTAPSIAVGATLLHDEYGQVSRRVEWSIFGPPQPFAQVPAARDGLLRSITPRIAIGTFGDGRGDGVGMTFGLDARMEFGKTGDGTFQQATVDGRIRVWPIRGELSFAGHARVIASEGDIPPQRAIALGGFGSIPSHPLNAYRLGTGSFWAFEALVRPFLKDRSRLLQDISLVAGGDWCIIERADGEQETHGGIGFYLSTATGAMRVGIAIPTDGEFQPRLAVRLEHPF